MNTFLKAVLAVAVSASTLPALAGNIELGRQKAEEGACVGCHGVDGVAVTDPTYPILAGQYEDFLERALLDYQRGARQNALMTGMAAALSKEDIKNLAAYYASLKSPLTTIRR